MGTNQTCGAPLVAQKVKNLPGMQEIARFDPWVRKIPWRKEWLPIPMFMENSMNRKAWWATVHGVTNLQAFAKQRKSLKTNKKMKRQPTEWEKIFVNDDNQQRLNFQNI